MPLLHNPVMLADVLHFAGIKQAEHLDAKTFSSKDYNKNSQIADATFGFGGYSRALISSFDGKLTSFDRDPSVAPYANELKSSHGERFDFVNEKFSSMGGVLKPNSCDLIVADFGISSMQVDDADRGFSFMQDAPLDMRMNKNDKISAFEVINELSEKELADIIFNYGEERLAKKIAYNIVHNRRLSPIKTTKQLADIAFKCYGKMAYSLKIHPATRTFQAIRIYVNKELDEIESLLSQTLSLLKPGGRFVCVSFHSLEDVIVKQFVKNNCKKVKVNKYQQFSLLQKDGQDEFTNKIIDLSLGAVEVSKEEAKLNPRSRSAKLRAFEKI